ncbi:hypothetical protein RD055328_01090 [Companilactobacillus sp. RD055328]|uniref:DUF956 family protein n=1 Tax=Companilactobacillus sp. RD055328 TaxID=2916634 RepID=UPI001FC84319|nr:DUF956 family protein [Companilactobacillus sp. RD055328]GKQ42186.1 hypothetical protein RD055328_01090 [Companilactobacillus sp. RD055328]
MISSINTKADLTIKATSFLGMTSYGKIMIGDKGFEYFSDRNINDFIQIPWNEVDQVIVSVVFNKFIPRFAIKTKKNGMFTFSSKDSKKTLRAIRVYVGPENIVKSLSFWDTIKRGFKGIFTKKSR